MRRSRNTEADFRDRRDGYNRDQRSREDGLNRYYNDKDQSRSGQNVDQFHYEERLPQYDLDYQHYDRGQVTRENSSSKHLDDRRYSYSDRFANARDDYLTETDVVRRDQYRQEEYKQDENRRGEYDRRTDKNLEQFDHRFDSQVTGREITGIGRNHRRAEDQLEGSRQDIYRDTRESYDDKEKERHADLRTQEFSDRRAGDYFSGKDHGSFRQSVDEWASRGQDRFSRSIHHEGKNSLMEEKGSWQQKTRYKTQKADVSREIPSLSRKDSKQDHGDSRPRGDHSHQGSGPSRSNSSKDQIKASGKALQSSKHADHKKSSSKTDYTKPGREYIKSGTKKQEQNVDNRKVEADVRNKAERKHSFSDNRGHAKTVERSASQSRADDFKRPHDVKSKTRISSGMKSEYEFHEEDVLSIMADDDGFDRETGRIHSESFVTQDRSTHGKEYDDREYANTETYPRQSGSSDKVRHASESVESRQQSGQNNSSNYKQFKLGIKSFKSRPHSFVTNFRNRSIHNTKSKFGNNSFTGRSNRFARSRQYNENNTQFSGKGRQTNLSFQKSERHFPKSSSKFTMPNRFRGPQIKNDFKRFDDPESSERKRAFSDDYSRRGTDPEKFSSCTTKLIDHRNKFTGKNKGHGFVNKSKGLQHYDRMKKKYLRGGQGKRYQPTGQQRGAIDNERNADKYNEETENTYRDERRAGEMFIDDERKIVVGNDGVLGPVPQQQVFFIPNPELAGMQPQFVDQYGNVIVNPEVGIQQDQPIHFISQPDGQDMGNGQEQQQVFFIPFNQMPGLPDSLEHQPLISNERSLDDPERVNTRNIDGSRRKINRVKPQIKKPLSSEARAKIKQQLALKRRQRLEREIEQKVIKKLLKSAQIPGTSINKEEATRKKPVLKRISPPSKTSHLNKKVKLVKGGREIQPEYEVVSGEDDYENISDYEDVSDDDEGSKEKRPVFRKPGQPRITGLHKGIKRTEEDEAEKKTGDVRHVVEKSWKEPIRRTVHVEHKQVMRRARRSISPIEITVSNDKYSNISKNEGRTELKHERTPESHSSESSERYDKMKIENNEKKRSENEKERYSDRKNSLRGRSEERHRSRDRSRERVERRKSRENPGDKIERRRSRDKIERHRSRSPERKRDSGKYFKDNAENQYKTKGPGCYDNTNEKDVQNDRDNRDKRRDADRNPRSPDRRVTSPRRRSRSPHQQSRSPRRSKPDDRRDRSRSPRRRSRERNQSNDATRNRNEYTSRDESSKYSLYPTSSHVISSMSGITPSFPYQTQTPVLSLDQSLPPQHQSLTAMSAPIPPPFLQNLEPQNQLSDMSMPPPLMGNVHSSMSSLVIPQQAPMQHQISSAQFQQNILQTQPSQNQTQYPQQQLQAMNQAQMGQHMQSNTSNPLFPVHQTGNQQFLQGNQSTMPIMSVGQPGQQQAHIHQAQSMVSMNPSQVPQGQTYNMSHMLGQTRSNISNDGNQQAASFVAASQPTVRAVLGTLSGGSKTSQIVGQQSVVLGSKTQMRSFVMQNTSNLGFQSVRTGATEKGNNKRNYGGRDSNRTEDDEDEETFEMICSHCEKVFLNQGAMRKHSLWHQRMSTNETRLRCDSCEQAFTNTLSYNSHQREKHFIEALNCSMCDKTFNSIAQYERHCSQFHSQVSVQHSCPMCPATFQQIRHLLQHKRDHHSSYRK
ncbi:uncharacterized protein LOC128231407 [Mya arenaria]|uniref:uncharacterized protein LOC128231407 n=1 Tax=Mya arenaria TaxID=6604 RepID=UPI0022E3D012|nr:uncharacterized protein LOC128231407 [Mya arenaria]